MKRKSSYSNPYANCVEVEEVSFATDPERFKLLVAAYTKTWDNDTVYVLSDSKHPGGPIFVFTPGEWEAFIAGAKDGEFDVPATSPAEVDTIIEVTTPDGLVYHRDFSCRAAPSPKSPFARKLQVISDRMLDPNVLAHEGAVCYCLRPTGE